jgi:hypothetical protein
MLGREGSLAIGAATAAVVWGIYNGALPTIAECRVSDEDDRDLAATERTAAWTAAAVVGGISLIAKDPTVFVIGGSMIVILSWWHRHANQHAPTMGNSAVPSARRVMAEDVSAGYEPSLVG